jgi:hypothetical protein
MERIDINQAIHNDTPIIRWGNDPGGILCDHYFTSNINSTEICHKHGRPKFEIEIGGELIGLKGAVLCSACVEEFICEREVKYLKITQNTSGGPWWLLVVALVFGIYSLIILSLYYMMFI